MSFDKEFMTLFESILEPKLRNSGFERVILAAGWISPEYLFEKDGIWFGCSWDWRERYLEIDLGHLFFFEDVLPSVIVYGPFESYVNLLGADIAGNSDCPGVRDGSYLTYKFTLVVKYIDRILEDFDRLYGLFQKESSETLSNTRKGRKVRRDFLVHLGRELRREDLPIV